MSPPVNFYERALSPWLSGPDTPLLETPDGRTLTYGEMDRLTGRFASALAALGCEPGSWVAVCAEKSQESLALYLACLRAGLVYLPLNTAYQPAELGYFLEDAAPRVLVCTPRHAMEMREVAYRAGVRHVFTLDESGAGTWADAAREASPEFTAVPRGDNDLNAVLYTSGTTGRPKGATISRRAIEHAALTLGRIWGFTRDDVLLHALPIFHGHGLFVACNVALAAGARMIFQPRFQLDALLDALPRATVLMGVPTFYHRIVADGRFTRETFAHLRLVTCGSAPLTPENQERFRDRFGVDIVQRYGTTETMILTSNPLDGERRAGSVGRALPDVELRIADRDDRPLPDGEIGMIQVRGPGLFSGYWRMPGKTAEDFTADGYFRTGDLGTRDTDGYVAITGRAKDLIISGGYNVYPAEVETVLNACPGVAESAVIGIPHADFGEAVTAVVIRAPNGPAVDGPSLVARAKELLANYKVPKHVVFVDEFPRNALGKIQKNLLRERYGKAGALPGQ
ncbi:MAG: AMP-binding protein [Betaproteobacteria bacterium]|nr:AMP-binding protein [Betaproteobacteria bacterium]